MINTDGMTIETAIVAQACEDYRQAIRGRGENPKKMLADTMRFFKSNWFIALTNVDWRYLVQKLDKEWEDGKKLIEAGKDIVCPDLKKDYKFICPFCNGTAITRETRHISNAAKNGNRTISYFRLFKCDKCHINERILIRSEAIQND